MTYLCGSCAARLDWSVRAPMVATVRFCPPENGPCHELGQRNHRWKTDAGDLADIWDDLPPAV